ncbi:MAG TPA: TetR/AcrR family transcriptional regulator [Pseudonocardiaceae bacterium]|jgi:AcrR family transcriptional regulator
MADGNGRPEPADGRAARWAGQRDKRRAEIVRAAVVAIGEHGPGVSTGQIATAAGIARPALYRRFTDAQDLHDAVARHIATLFITELAPVLTEPTGSARDTITRAVNSFVRWLTDNTSLYHYVVSRPAETHSDHPPAIADVRNTISLLLRDLLAGYLTVFERDTHAADPLAFGLVGLVESATARWLEAPHPFDRDGLIAQLSAWIWGLLDTVLRGEGMVLDPDRPLPELPNHAD